MPTGLVKISQYCGGVWDTSYLIFPLSHSPLPIACHLNAFPAFHSPFRFSLSKSLMHLFQFLPSGMSWEFPEGRHSSMEVGDGEEGRRVIKERYSPRWEAWAPQVEGSLAEATSSSAFPSSKQEGRSCGEETWVLGLSFPCLKLQLSHQTSCDHETRNEHGPTIRGSSWVTCESFTQPESPKSSLAPGWGLSQIWFVLKTVQWWDFTCGVAKLLREEDSKPPHPDNEQTRLRGSRPTQVWSPALPPTS